MPKTTTPRRSARQKARRQQKYQKPSEGANELPLREDRLLREKSSIFDRPVSPADLPTPDKPPVDAAEAIINPTIAATILSNTSPYTHFNVNRAAHREFTRKFLQNSFGLVCDICDRLWFKNDLSQLPINFKKLVSPKYPTADLDKMVVCKYCINSLMYNHIPTFATINGFTYPERPDYLPQLDPISERLISPRIPLQKIQRLRHANHFENLVQIINIPVSENNMVHHLPRRLDDDYCTYVDIERREVRRSNDFIESVDKQGIITWLQYLVNTPLYKANDITIDNSFPNDMKSQGEDEDVEVIEHLPNRDSLLAQQHTLIWSVEEYLKRDDREGKAYDRLFNGHAEELSFPCIYLGQPRVFKDRLKVTSSMIATSELTRSDRRGVTPDHLLYMAMKIMRLNVHETINSICKHLKEDPNAFRQQLLSEETVADRLRSSLAFLRYIPNSTWYWKERQRDLVGMIRTLGKPTISLTMSANEIGWIPLLQLLYKLKNKGTEISEEFASKLSYVEKSALVNDDVVTCVIYFNKMVSVLLSLLKSPDGNPFRQYRVLHHFQRIEFRYHRSPCIHILLWLDNAPKDPLGADKEATVNLIDQLISVSTGEASGHIELQAHKHTSACYKDLVGTQICRFEAPFMPCRSTTIIEPMLRTDPKFPKNAQHYQEIRNNLEKSDYPDIDAFYNDNDISSDAQYMDILRAGINQPRIFLKRKPSEKWHEAFNPFILNVLQGHMNIQFITDVKSCSDAIVDYIHKTDRNIGELQRKIVAIIDQHPEFKLNEVMRRLSDDVLKTVEITSQEAAWYLLREPMVKSSSIIVPIQTVMPCARQAMRKSYDEFVPLESPENASDFRKENWFAMYEARAIGLDRVSLAQFVANYTRNFNNTMYVKRKTPRIIRYENYNMATHPNDYKREMVTLHVPFYNEELEIIAGMRFLQLYDTHYNLIIKGRREFEADKNDQIMEELNQLYRETDGTNDDDEVNGVDEDDGMNYLTVVPQLPVTDPFQDLYDERNPGLDDQLELMVVDETSDGPKSHENSLDGFVADEPVFIVPEETDVHPMHGMFTLFTGPASPFQMFLSGPANCRKTFIIRLLMEIYNRYAKADGSCNLYINLTPTDNAKDPANQTSTYTALTISLSKILSLSLESTLQYRDLVKYVQVLVIDEVYNFHVNILSEIDASLKRLTNNCKLSFGGINILLTGDFQQLTPVEAKVINRDWNDLKFLDAGKIVCQSNQLFPLLLTKIKQNVDLEEFELELLESRFFSKKEADRLLPHGIHLMLSDEAADEYYKAILRSFQDKVISLAKDSYSYSDRTEEKRSAHSLRNMPVDQTAGLPSEIAFVMDKSYMLTTTVDELPGIPAGSLGKLVFIEYDDDDQASRVWLEFYNKPKNFVDDMRAKDISKSAVPVKRQTSTIYLNAEKTVLATRHQFPLVPAFAITINKAQGFHMNEMIYEYSRSHSEELMLMALSQISNVTKLYIVTSSNDPTFYHGRKKLSSTKCSTEKSLDIERNKPLTLDKAIIDFISSRSGLAVFSFNCQSQTSEGCSGDAGGKSEILFLSEVSLENEEAPVMPDFNCIVRFRRSGINDSAVCYRDHDIANIVTRHMNIRLLRGTRLTVNSTNDGEICTARCILDDDQTLLTVILYLSANQDISQRIAFMNEVLLEFSIRGAAPLGNGLDKIPIILSGDFNINFESPEAQQLIEFLDTEFNLKVNRKRVMTTTKPIATNDAVFFRYLEKLQSTTYVSYFSYDRPAVMDDNCGETDLL